MKILVTGGLGVIGSLFASEMLTAGHDVAVLDACEKPRNFWTQDVLRKHPLAANLEIFVGRLERGNLPNVENYDLILHAAAHTGIPHSAEDPGDDWVSNVDATRALLEACRKAPRCPNVVALSSVKPYRVHDLPVRETVLRYIWEPERSGIDESYLLEPDEPYAASKMAQSALCMAYARSFDLPVTVLRCSNLYGAAPCHGPRHGWLTWFCISAALGKPIEVQGSGKQVRDMLFSSDVTQAVLAASVCMPQTRGNVYNIGGGVNNTISVLEAAALTVKLNPESIGFVAPGRKNEDPVFVVNHDKFSRVTGWQPKVSVEHGMAEIYMWAEKNIAELSRIYS